MTRIYTVVMEAVGPAGYSVLTIHEHYLHVLPGWHLRKVVNSSHFLAKYLTIFKLLSNLIFVASLLHTGQNDEGVLKTVNIHAYKL